MKQYITIRSFRDEDIVLMERWLKEPHVAEWYKHPDHWLQELKERHGEFKFLTHFIAEYNGTPVGFCQYYDCYFAQAHEVWNDEWRVDDKQGEIYSIDYLIGEPDFLRRGFAKQMVVQMIEKIWALGAKKIIVEPEKENTASNCLLESSGFKLQNGVYVLGNGIHIEKAARDDLFRIVEFLHNSWQAEYRQIVSDDYLDTMSVENRYKGLLAKYDEKSWEFLMMTDGDKLIGAAVYGKSFTDGYHDDGEIPAIYLRSAYIGKGYGNKLFTYAEQMLTKKGYQNFVLDVLTDNARAVNFYQKHGYKPVDNRKVALGEKEYPLTVMRKENAYRSEFSDVDYLKDLNVVFVTWKKFCKNDDYRKPLLFALDMMRQNPGCQYVADTRNGFENEEADTKWLFDVFLPETAKTDCKNIFFIIDKNNSLKEELEGQAVELKKLFKVYYCFDLDEVKRLL